MKIAYLICTHNNPNLLPLQIKALNTANCGFFIHVDKKAEFDRFFFKCQNVVFLTNRVIVEYCSYSIVQATLLLMKEVIISKGKFDYLILLSGSDYPLQSASYIEEFLTLNKGKEFINSIQMPALNVGKPISRLKYLNFTHDDNVLLRKIFSKLKNRGIRISRNYEKVLKGMAPCGGSAWWVLSRRACEYILNFLEKNRQFTNFYKHTMHPDEMIFQTILMNSPFKENIYRNITYTDWSDNGSHPAILNNNHLLEFSRENKVMIDDNYGKGEVLFARKFSDDNLDLVHKMNSIIGEKEQERNTEV